MNDADTARWLPEQGHAESLMILLHDDLVVRILFFAGRQARLPESAPAQTTPHLFHGADD